MLAPATAALALLLQAAPATTGPAAGPTTAPAPAERLMADVTELATTYADRDPTHPAVYAAAADWIATRVADLGHEARREGFEVQVDGEAVGCVNLIVDLPGTDADLPVLIVGAHYDSVPASPGADDNATGVAAVLELLRRLDGVAHARPLRLIFWGNEEPPYWQTERMGSAVNAAATAEAAEPVHGVISLDMLGYYDETPGSQTVPPGMEAIVPTTATFLAAGGPPVSAGLLAEVAAAWGDDPDLPLVTTVIPEGSDLSGMSDHHPYTRHGVPGVIVTDTSFLRSRHYHRPSDTPATLDEERFRHAVNGVERVILELAGVPDAE